MYVPDPGRPGMVMIGVTVGLCRVELEGMPMGPVGSMTFRSPLARDCQVLESRRLQRGLYLHLLRTSSALWWVQGEV